MRVIRWEHNCNWDEVIKVTPIGDIHLGSIACNEKLLQKVISKIERESNHYWLCMGDVGNYINMNDPRFSAEELARWVRPRDLVDLTSAETNRFLDYIKPIAHKCLAVLKGNHEETASRHTERDIHLETVNGIKRLGKMEPERKLSLGYYGWLQLVFRRQGKRERSDGTSIFNLNMHHGFGGGKTAGSKANNMQKWLWQHNADLVIFGHTHSTSWQPEAVEEITSGGVVRHRLRQGCYSGTFLATNALESTTYSEVKGYPPLPLSGVEIIISPFAERSLRVNGLGAL